MLSVRNSCNDRILMSLPIEISRLSVEFEGKVVRDLLLIREMEKYTMENSKVGNSYVSFLYLCR